MKNEKADLGSYYFLNVIFSRHTKSISDEPCWVESLFDLSPVICDGNFKILFATLSILLHSHHHQ